MKIRLWLTALALPLLASCEGALFGALNLASPTQGVEARRDIVFDPAHALSLDVWRPKSTPAAGAPVVVFFYGGTWKRGARGQYAYVGRSLAARGVVTVVPDYRKFPKVQFPTFVDDAAAAVAWAHTHASEFGGDPHRIFVMGHSAGGHIAALLATDKSYLAKFDLAPRDLAGMIGLAGVYDFLPITDPDLVEIFGPDQARMQASQPVAYVDGDEPPMLLMHGTADGTVWPRNSDSLAAKLREHGEPVELIKYPNVGHSGIFLALSRPFAGRVPVIDDTLRFIEKTPAVR